LVAQDDDTRPGLVGVGGYQFGDDREHLRRPAQDKGVLGFASSNLTLLTWRKQIIQFDMLWGGV